mmetsp:Transcript_25293/g.66137  ORF Transcript_25293/g.66137 Transcript_25293/m.66137 type:complete len:274 (-) Transcript_25293:1460-2281(-)
MCQQRLCCIRRAHRTTTSAWTCCNCSRPSHRWCAIYNPFARSPLPTPGYRSTCGWVPRGSKRICTSTPATTLLRSSTAASGSRFSRQTRRCTRGHACTRTSGTPKSTGGAATLRLGSHGSIQQLLCQWKWAGVICSSSRPTGGITWRPRHRHPFRSTCGLMHQHIHCSTKRTPSRSHWRPSGRWQSERQRPWSLCGGWLTVCLMGAAAGLQRLPPSCTTTVGRGLWQLATWMCRPPRSSARRAGRPCRWQCRHRLTLARLTSEQRQCAASSPR